MAIPSLALVVQLDFQQAFEILDHKILMSKPRAFGVCGELPNWLADFLHERTQRIVFRGAMSDAVEVLSGVPQGSVLGPHSFQCVHQ